MIKILEESAKFNATSQRLADQTCMILNKGWFSELKILELYRIKVIVVNRSRG